MPSFDVELGDIYNELDKWEIESLIDWLREDGWLTKYIAEHKLEAPNAVSPSSDWREVMAQLNQAYYRLTPEDTATIEALSNKYKYY